MKIGKLNFRTGLDETPARIIFFGPGSIGKTTLACSAPNPLLISCEDGGREFRVPTQVYDEVKDRIVPESYAELLGTLNEIAASDTGDRASLILDGHHQIDILCQEEVVRSNSKWKSIQDPGFGKGEAEVLAKWRPIVQKLDEINRRKKMRIIITGHSQQVKFKDPEGPEYDRHDLLVTKHPKGDVAAFLFGWAEVVGFCRFENLTNTTGTGNRQRVVAVSTQGDRLMHLALTTAYQAKCRFSGAPETVKLTHDDGTPKTYQDIFGDLEMKTPERMRAEFEKLFATMAADEVKPWRKRVEQAGEDVPTLARGLEKLKSIVGLQEVA